MRVTVLYDQPADPAAFDKYYSEIHIPLAKQLPGLLRYTVSRGLRDKQYYLVAELDFESMEAMGAAFGSEIGKQTAADVENFASGASRTLIFEVEEV